MKNNLEKLYGRDPPIKKCSIFYAGGLQMPCELAFILSGQQYSVNSQPPGTTRRWPNVVLMLGQRRRWWNSIKTTFDHYLVLAGPSIKSKIKTRN